MASIVDTSVKHYLSTMSGAPQLSGTAGSLIALLDAVLVNGFDTKTLTGLTVAGGVATAAFSGSHSATVDSVITVAGSSIAVLNGEQKVTAVGAGVVRFATEAADGTASGTITIKMAPAGWAKVFSGTNLAVYKSTDVQANGHMLRVDDTNAQFARVVGYESMTDVNTGTGPFPTATQASGGGVWGKSYTASTNPVIYSVWADTRTFFFIAAAYTGNSADATYRKYSAGGVRGFGDMIAARPSGDVFSTALSCNIDTNWQPAPTGGSFDFGNASGIFMPRPPSGLGSSQPQNSVPYTGSAGTLSGADNGGLGLFPSTIDGSLRLSRRWLRTFSPNSQAETNPRADIPGLYTVPMSQVRFALGHAQKIPGTGSLAGRSLLALDVASSYGANPDTSNQVGSVIVDVTGPWR